MSSKKEAIESIETSLEYGRDTTAEQLDSIGYEQFWDEKDEALSYVNERLSETKWRTNFSTREDAVYHFAISEQTANLDTTTGTIQPSGPTSPF